MDMLFIDYAKDFNEVSHCNSRNLEPYTRLLYWIADYLSERPQMSLIVAAFLQPFALALAYHKATFWGLWLFFLLITDVGKNIPVKTCLYADNCVFTVCYITILSRRLSRYWLKNNFTVF